MGIRLLSPYLWENRPIFPIAGANRARITRAPARDGRNFEGDFALFFDVWPNARSRERALNARVIGETHI